MELLVRLPTGTHKKMSVTSNTTVSNLKKKITESSGIHFENNNSDSFGYGIFYLGKDISSKSDKTLGELKVTKNSELTVRGGRDRAMGGKRRGTRKNNMMGGKRRNRKTNATRRNRKH